MKKDKLNSEMSPIEEKLSPFGIYCKFAAIGGYSVDDALFFYGISKLSECELTESEIDKMFPKKK